MKIIVGYSYPRRFKIGAFLISWWMKRPYSHVFIRYTDNQNRDLIFHAAHGTVHPILVKNFEVENKIVKEDVLFFTDEEYQQLRDIYYEKSGKLYSTKQIILMPIHDAGLACNIKIKTEDDDGYICSELVGYCLNKVKGIKFSKPFNYLRPDDIESALTKESLK
jgi:hypothetical protein